MQRMDGAVPRAPPARPSLSSICGRVYRAAAQKGAHLIHCLLDKVGIALLPTILSPPVRSLLFSSFKLYLSPFASPFYPAGRRVQSLFCNDGLLCPVAVLHAPRRPPRTTRTHVLLATFFALHLCARVASRRIDVPAALRTFSRIAPGPSCSSHEAMGRSMIGWLLFLPSHLPPTPTALSPQTFSLLHMSLRSAFA